METRGDERRREETRGDEGRRGETAVYREWSGSEKKRGEREVPLQLHDSITMDDEVSRSRASGPSDPG
jgi:hypothetical protein